jgi:photosystem II PsbU protein
MNIFDWLVVFMEVNVVLSYIWKRLGFWHFCSRFYIFLYYHSAVAAFVTPSGVQQRSATALSADRRDFLASAAAAAFTAGAFVLPANAIRDYENIGLLGGGEIVDINNANIRVYLKMPGLYPTVAGKLVKNTPYKSVSDIYNIPGLTGPEKEVMKKYEARFVTKEPSADFVIDRFNNGL